MRRQRRIFAYSNNYTKHTLNETTGGGLAQTHYGYCHQPFNVYEHSTFLSGLSPLCVQHLSFHDVSNYKLTVGCVYYPFLQCLFHFSLQCTTFSLPQNIFKSVFKTTGNGWHKNVFQIYPIVVSNPILVIDNAPYHKAQSKKSPNSSSTTNSTQKWLRSNRVPFDESMLKVQ